MNEANFVKRIDWIATGDSFLKEMVLPLDAFKVTASGIPIGSATAPTSAVNGVSYNDGDTALLTFMVPMDYDVDGDRLVFKATVVAASDAGTTDMGLTNAQTIWRPGSAADATAATAKAETATATSGLATREVFLSISGGSYQPGDIIRRTVDVNNSSTGELMMLAASIVYGSSFAAYNNDDRHRDMNASTGD